MAAALFAMASAFAACGGGDGAGASGCAGEAASAEADTPAFAPSEADTHVAVVLRDYVFQGLPARVEGPNVSFEAKVSGSGCHELEVLDSSGAAMGEIPAFRGNATRTLAVTLRPGTYTVQCLVKEGSKTHADLGMKASLAVG